MNAKDHQAIAGILSRLGGCSDRTDTRDCVTQWLADYMAAEDAKSQHLPGNEPAQAFDRDKFIQACYGE